MVAFIDGSAPGIIFQMVGTAPTWRGPNVNRQPYCSKGICLRYLRLYTIGIV